ncbi:hypothetical protein CDEST_06409 [Colletotrichum destructivum]|uniref:Uncharacterized protein n=1 Tax=Colletotrichum destructivum TaxID=34406 RepID=A0AAX4IDN7_9PEZI|nr:hypothetical protein CDEST_06409 [Colletotrichum destructivum]
MDRLDESTWHTVQTLPGPSPAQANSGVGDWGDESVDSRERKPAAVRQRQTQQGLQSEPQGAPAVKP